MKPTLGRQEAVNKETGSWAFRDRKLEIGRLEVGDEKGRAVAAFWRRPG